MGKNASVRKVYVRVEKVIGKSIPVVDDSGNVVEVSDESESVL
jgi:hypothetical protein